MINKLFNIIAFLFDTLLFSNPGFGEDLEIIQDIRNEDYHDLIIQKHNKHDNF